MTNLSKWLPTVLTVGLAVLGESTPQIQHVISAHPNLALSLGAVYAVLKGLLPSPVVSK